MDPNILCIVSNSDSNSQQFPKLPSQSRYVKNLTLYSNCKYHLMMENYQNVFARVPDFANVGLNLRQHEPNLNSWNNQTLTFLWFPYNMYIMHTSLLCSWWRFWCFSLRHMGGRTGYALLSISFIPVQYHLYQQPSHECCRPWCGSWWSLHQWIFRDHGRR